MNMLKSIVQKIMLLIVSESRYRLIEEGITGPRIVTTKKVAIDTTYPARRREYFLR